MTSSRGRSFRDAAALFCLASAITACASEYRKSDDAPREQGAFERAVRSDEATASDGISIRKNAEAREDHVHAVAASIETARRLATTTELRPRPPALLARAHGTELEELPLRALRVAAVLGATRARVLVEATFENPYPTVLEGTFAARLPDGASPEAMGMFLGAGPGRGANPFELLAPPIDPRRLLAPELALDRSWPGRDRSVVDWEIDRPGKFVGQAAGLQVFENTTRQRVDPALLEWSGGSSYRTRIYPVPALGMKRVYFAYDQPPSIEEGRAALALPVPDPLPPAFRLEVAADPGAYAAAAIAAPTGDTPLAPHGNFLAMQWSKEKAAVLPKGGAFVLAATPRESRVRSGYSSTAGIGGALVHARLSPTVHTSADAPTKSAVFVLDTSLSQRGNAARAAGHLLREVLARDTTIERFRVVTFDVEGRDLFEGWRENTPAECARTLAEVESLWLEGATSLEAALAHLDASGVAEREDPTFFLLSDGQLTWGESDARALERAHPRLFESRWIGYQVGDSAVNRPLLDRLCRRGRVVPVLSPDDMAAAALAHRASPVALRNVRVEGVRARDLVVAGSPLSLYPNQPLEVAFRLAPGDDPTAARVIVESEDGRESFALTNARADDPLAARAWAELAANRLLDQQDAEADKLALALSERFGLVNRVASILVLETDWAYQRTDLTPELLDVDAIASRAKARALGKPLGEPDGDALPQEVQDLIAAVSDVRAAPWSRPVPARRARLGPTRWPEHLDPFAVYREAERRFMAGWPEDAMRVLSSLVEENPRDAQSLRLVAFCCLGWGRSAEAASLFERTRALRPFEPQCLLSEAIALEAAGFPGRAALRYELVLHQRFDGRHDSKCKAAARRFYGRLLETIASISKGKVRAAAQDRYDELRLHADERSTTHEVSLLWNLDDTDVDLHVIERGRRGFSGETVDYGNPRSFTGGRLLWDDTTGLGPEIFTNDRNGPAEVYVQYFGTRSISGRVPSATLVVVRSGGECQARASVLEDVNDRCVLWRDAEPN